MLSFFRSFTFFYKNPKRLRRFHMSKGVTGSLAICINPNCFITSIIATDVSDVDSVMESLQKHCGWELIHSEKVRHYTEFIPTEKTLLRGFSTIQQKICNDCSDQITSISVVTSEMKSITKIILKNLDGKIEDEEKRLSRCKIELKETTQRGGDSIDTATSQNALQTIHGRMKDLEISLQKKILLRKKLSQKTWNGFCSNCKTEPVPFGRVELNDSLTCIGCAL